VCVKLPRLYKVAPIDGTLSINMYIEVNYTYESDLFIFLNIRLLGLETKVFFMKNSLSV